jgi:hypothetical protein
MRLGPHRRNLVVWSSSACPADRGRGLWFRRPVRSRRIPRWLRTGSLLAVIGLIRLAAAVRPRWRPLTAGVVLTVAGVVLRSGTAGVVMIPGMLFLISALLAPVDPVAASLRRRELERELAAYCTPDQRCDLEATLDRYPDSVTREMRDILVRQAEIAGRGREG